MRNMVVKIFFPRLTHARLPRCPPTPSWNTRRVRSLGPDPPLNVMNWKWFDDLNRRLMSKTSATPAPL